jgi:hypothetical protein
MLQQSVNVVYVYMWTFLSTILKCIRLQWAHFQKVFFFQILIKTVEMYFLDIPIKFCLKDQLLIKL